MNLTDESMDARIRAALKDAEKKGALPVVAAVTGISGGVDELRKIMNSTEPLHIMDRGMLGVHLDLHPHPAPLNGAFSWRTQ